MLKFHPASQSLQTCNPEVCALAPAGAPADVHRVLVFNCMKERDPAVLLPALAARLASHGTHMHHALFVPPESQYGFLPTQKQPNPTAAAAAAAGQDPAAVVPDFSWQQGLQQVWEEKCTGTGSAVAQAGKPGQLPVLPPATGECLAGINQVLSIVL